MDTNLKAVAQSMIDSLAAAPGMSCIDSSDRHPSDVVMTPTGESVTFDMVKDVTTSSRDTRGRDQTLGRIVYEVRITARYVSEEE